MVSLRSGTTLSRKIFIDFLIISFYFVSIAINLNYRLVMKENSGKSSSFVNRMKNILTKKDNVFYVVIAFFMVIILYLQLNIMCKISRLARPIKNFNAIRKNAVNSELKRIQQKTADTQKPQKNVPANVGNKTIKKK